MIYSLLKFKVAITQLAMKIIVYIFTKMITYEQSRALTLSTVDVITIT